MCVQINLNEPISFAAPVIFGGLTSSVPAGSAKYRPTVVNNVFIEVNGKDGLINFIVKKSLDITYKKDTETNEPTTYNKLRSKLQIKLRSKGDIRDIQAITNKDIDNYRPPLYTIEHRQFENKLFNPSEKGKLDTTLKLFQEGSENTKEFRDYDNEFRFQLKANADNKMVVSNTWLLKPKNVEISRIMNPLASQAIKADIDKDTEGFEEGQPIIKITFDEFRLPARYGGMAGIKSPPPPPVIIAVAGLTQYKRKSGEIVSLIGKSPSEVAEYVKVALKIPTGDGTLPTTPVTRGGAIKHIDDTIDEIPYVLSLQRLWEDKLKHYNTIEPEYQQMLPPPEQSPVQDLQEPFHRYMDDFGDQDLLEEARDTIGLMRPEDAEDLFHNDKSHINDMYEKALPDVDDRLIPIFIRADILRLLSR